MKKVIISIVVLFLLTIFGVFQFIKAEMYSDAAFSFFADAHKMKKMENGKRDFVSSKSERKKMGNKENENYNLAVKNFPFNYRHYVRLGNSYLDLEKPNEAKYSFIKARLLGWQVFGNKAKYFSSMATLNSKLGNVEKSKLYRTSKLNEWCEGDYSDGAMVAGLAFLKDGDIEKAKNCFQNAESLGIIEDNDNLNIEQTSYVYQRLSFVYYEMGNLEEAIKYKNKLSELVADNKKNSLL